MDCKIIDGKAMAAEIRREVAERVASLKQKGIEPCLAVILVGDNPASVSYVTGKQKALAECGMKDVSMRLPQDTSESELLELISKFNFRSRLKLTKKKFCLPSIPKRTWTDFIP